MDALRCIIATLKIENIYNLSLKISIEWRYAHCMMLMVNVHLCNICIYQFHFVVFDHTHAYKHTRAHTHKQTHIHTYNHTITQTHTHAHTTNTY